MATALIVQKSFDGALSTPTFLIKYTDPANPGNVPIYYLALATWRYDKNQANLSPAQLSGCDKIAQDYVVGENAAAAPGAPVVTVVIRNGPPGDGSDDMNHTA